MQKSIAEGIANLNTIVASQPKLTDSERAEYERVCARLDRATGDLRRATKKGDAKKIAAAERAVARHTAARKALVDPHVGHLWAPERIIAKSEGHWHGPSGTGIHYQECEMVLDHKDLSGPSYRTVRVVKDVGGPPTNARTPFHGMGVAWFAIKEQIQRGKIIVLAVEGTPG